jgi:hypothetical protein
VKKLALFVLAVSFILSGCRREDVRDFTLVIPDLCSTNKAVIVEALAKYNGVIKDSYQWDLEAKTLTLKYDSMQIAKENIRQAIEAKNISVKR